MMIFGDQILSTNNFILVLGGKTDSRCCRLQSQSFLEGSIEVFEFL
jgi:hypothetical protein